MRFERLGSMVKANTTPSKGYYLVTTEHLKKGLWFRDNEDYRVGMNYVAIHLSFVE